MSLGITKETNRVYVGYNGKNGQPLDEYVTPADGVEAYQVQSRIMAIIRMLEDRDVALYNVGDIDVDYQRKKEQEADRQDAQNEAAAAPFEAVAFLLNGNWEFTGASTFKEARKISDIGRSPYVPLKQYSFIEARFRIAYGSKHLRFNLAPLAFNWLSLPSYKKYNTSGSLIKYTDFSDTRFYSPSIGLSYMFFPKKELLNRHRNYELSVSANYALLVSPKNEDVEVKDVAYDTEFKEYFKGTPSIIQATLGGDFFLSKGFGIGLHGGIYYMNIEATDDVLTETVNGTQKKFTIKFDDINKVVPHAALKLILRF
jgi:hypothetical protein